MAGVTSEMLAGMLKTNLSNLKSFAEQLNAELAEDAQESDDRESQKRDISHILETFETAEAFFEKGRKCLEKVDQEVKKSCKFDGVTSVEEDSVVNEIRNMIRSLEGKMKTQDISFEQNCDSESTGFTVQHLQDVEDILDDFHHPLKLDDPDDEEYDSEEEHKAIQLLESSQNQNQNQIPDEDQDDEYISPSLNVSDASDMRITPNSFERVENGKNNNTHLGYSHAEQLHNEYKNKLIPGSNVCPRQLYSSKIASEAEIDPEKLPTLSKFKESILELFSKDAIVVVENRQSYIDPISRTQIQTPVRNKICDHIYEREVIYSLLQKKKTMACPCFGCSCRSFSAADLVEDEEIAERIMQNQTRARESGAHINEDSDTDPEVGPEDDTQSQEIL